MSGEKYQQESKGGAMDPAGTLQSLQHEASCRTVCMKPHSSACITQEMCFGSCTLPATFRASQASSQPALLFVSPDCFSSPLSYSSTCSGTLQEGVVSQEKAT